jgi:hypothetical protein
MGHKGIRNALLIAATSLGLGACTDGYGYGGVGMGYGGYYGDYYGDYYGPSYYGGSPYYGWYDNYSYPGSGYYVFDRYGTRRTWNDSQRRYWQSRRNNGGSWSGQHNPWNRSQNGGTWSGQRWNGGTQGGATVQGGSTGGAVQGGAWSGRWRGRQ